MKVIAALLILCAVSALAQVAPTTVTRTATIAAGGADTIQVPGATVPANSLFYVHVQCSGASTETDYTVLFNQGSAPSAGSSIQGVQTVFWNGIAQSAFSSEHVAPIAQAGVDIFYQINNKLTTALTCMSTTFLTTEVAPDLNAPFEYNATAPVMRYFTVTVPTANSLITVRLDDSDDDVSTHLRVLMKMGSRPTFADPLADVCDQFFGVEEEVSECLYAAAEAGTYYFGVYSSQNGVVAPPPREASVTFSVSADADDINSSEKRTFTLPAGGNMYFTVSPTTADLTLFLRVTTSKLVSVNAMLALDTFPTEFSRLREPRIVTEVDDADPDSVFAVSIVEASVLQMSTLHIRLYNAELSSVTYTIEPIFAKSARVLPGDDAVVSLDKGFQGLYRTVLDGTDNILLITLVSATPAAVWIREDIPPTINTADADFVSDISEAADGKIITRLIWSPNNGASPEGTWFFRVIPDSNVSSSFTLTVTSGHVSSLDDYSQLGGRLPANGIDYYRVAVPLDKVFGLYVRVDSKGAFTNSQFNSEGYPTDQEHTDLVSSRPYQVSWGPDAAVCEYYIMPKDLTKGNWTLNVMPMQANVEVFYALTSVLFEIYPIAKADEVQTYTMSQMKMAVLTYTLQTGQQHTDDLSLILSPADGIDVIVSRDIIPFTFEKSSSRSTFYTVNDNTITLTLASTTPGTYYFRVIASTAEKEVQASIHVGKFVKPLAPTGGQAAPVASSDNNGNNGNNSNNTGGNSNLLLILITVFLGLLVVILTVVVVMFVLRSKQTNAAEMSSIGSGDAKYSLLNEETRV